MEDTKDLTPEKLNDTEDRLDGATSCHHLGNGKKHESVEELPAKSSQSSHAESQRCTDREDDDNYFSRFLGIAWK